MELLSTVTTMITPILEEHEVYLDDIEYVKENNEWYLRIFVEKNEGFLDMDTCVAVSEKISEMLDEKDPVQGEYYLEVSSPGVEKPLKTFSQVQASVDKYVFAQFVNPINGLNDVEGYIREIDGEEITFEYLVKNIKKKVCVPYTNIKFIRLAVKF
ncbi:MAG: ribosome maturation factor RimP [Coprobacillaceae bacterium]